jgi:photosystem II stability/assembly factor-like uncharacterized protein
VYNGGQSQRSLFSVSFGDALNGVAVGSLGLAVGTADGGQSWEQRSIGAAPLLRGVWLTDASKGIAVGDGGMMLHTVDGGAHWELQRLGVIAALTGICLVGADTGTVVGYAGTILRTTDGGQNWLPQTSGTLLDLYDVFFTDGRTGSAVGKDGTVLRTTTGGENRVLRLRRGRQSNRWKRVPSVSTTPSFPCVVYLISANGFIRRMLALAPIRTLTPVSHDASPWSGSWLQLVKPTPA